MTYIHKNISEKIENILEQNCDQFGKVEYFWKNKIIYETPNFYENGIIFEIPKYFGESEFSFCNPNIFYKCEQIS